MKLKKLITYFIFFSFFAVANCLNTYYLYKVSTYEIDGIVVANSSTVNYNTVVSYINCGKFTYPLIMETQSNKANIIVVPKDTAQYKAFTINIPIDKAAKYKIGKTYKFEKIIMADYTDIVFIISFICGTICVLLSAIILIIIIVELWINND